MISKADILERAREWQLTPEVVEKDYVLGWLLAGVARHPRASSTWVFKGGTCLKKCVIETYRFSEDLDFSLRAEAEYTAAEVAAILREIVADVNELSGIQFPDSGLMVKDRRDLAGRPTLEGRIEYSGPLKFPGSPKIRLDLTRHEPILRAVDLRTVFHAYPDALPDGTRVATYATPELIAEKTRALWERMRPRDLYDVVILGAAPDLGAKVDELRVVAAEKFRVKGLELPSVADVVDRARGDEELHTEWENMLGHQLPATPPLGAFLDRLADAVAWIEGPVAAAPSQAAARPAGRVPSSHAGAALASVPLRSGETVFAPPGIRTWGVGAPLEAIRYAGASRLLVQFEYHDHRRVIEPYSLRRPGTGNLLIYGFERTKDGFPINEIRAYKVAEIGALKVLSEPFTPRYAIELTEQAGVWRW